jgi:hypothetical protein
MRRSTRRARGALQNELSPSAENVPPGEKEEYREHTTGEKTQRRATAALHGELTSVLRYGCSDSIIGSSRESSVREMEDP